MGRIRVWVFSRVRSAFFLEGWICFFQKSDLDPGKICPDPQPCSQPTHRYEGPRIGFLPLSFFLLIFSSFSLIWSSDLFLFHSFDLIIIFHLIFFFFFFPFLFLFFFFLSLSLSFWNVLLSLSSDIFLLTLSSDIFFPLSLSIFFFR